MTSTPTRLAPAPVDPQPTTKPYTNGNSAVKVPAAAAAEPLLADEELMMLGPKRPSATSKSTNGPPVYYPPDPMFTKKDAPILVINHYAKDSTSCCRLYIYLSRNSSLA